MAGLERQLTPIWATTQTTTVVIEKRLSCVQNIGCSRIALQPITLTDNSGNPSSKPKTQKRTSAQMIAEDLDSLRRKHINGERLGQMVENIRFMEHARVNSEAWAFHDYQFLFRGQRNEVEPIGLEVVGGCVPPDLEGTYYLQGPGILRDDHGSKVHPLDGHGYLRRFSFRSGKVEYSAKYVKTLAYREEFDIEKKSWKFTHRGAFSLLKRGERVGNMKVMKNVANTSVVEWAGKLMCFWEGGVPYEVDPTSLETAGVLTLRKEQVLDENLEYLSYRVQRGLEKHWDVSFIAQTLRKVVMAAAASILRPILIGIFKMAEERMLAHVKMDQKRQRLVCITCQPEDMLLEKCSLCIYEYDKEMNLVRKQKFTIDDHIMTHDWALTENYYIFVANRVKLNSLGHLGGALTGLTPMINAITLNDSLSYTPLYLLPRNENKSEAKSGRDWRIPVKVPKQIWLTHASNAYEERCVDDSTRIVFDGTACCYKWFSFAHLFGYNCDRARLDPAAMNDCNSADNSADKSPMKLIRVSLKIPADISEEPECDFQNWQSFRLSCDFPAINPSLLTMKHKYTYVAATSGRRNRLQHFPFDTIAKISGPGEKSTVASWWAGHRSFVGEPNFIRKPGSPDSSSPSFEEDAGYLITVQYCAMEETCYLVVLDAQKIGNEDAMVCRLRVAKKNSFPMGFHSSWEDLAHFAKESPASESSPT